MKKKLKIFFVGFIFFTLVTALVVSLSFIRCLLSGIEYSFHTALISGAKSGAIVGVATVIIFLIGEPHSRTPGG